MIARIGRIDRTRPTLRIGTINPHAEDTMLLDLIKAKVKDDSARLTDAADYTPALSGALERYSKHRPKDIVKDLAGDGTHDLALPAEWVEGFSQVRRVEYPIGEIPETLLDAGEWALYLSPLGLSLRLIEVAPVVTESVRVTLTVPRLEADIPPGDVDAVACLAASICLRTLAALYGQTSDPTIQADVVNYRSKMDEFRRMADSLEARFNAHLGIDKDGSAPAAGVVASAPRGGRPRLTH
ncbi:hypothetical protein [Desulfuromonas soudanensis]|nr:hypothetical protein [Desulfuromonas soudanensis]